MPELPEVETTRRGVEPHCVGRVIAAVVVVAIAVVVAAIAVVVAAIAVVVAAIAVVLVAVVFGVVVVVVVGTGGERTTICHCLVRHPVHDQFALNRKTS